MSMSARYVILHNPEPPAYYDIRIDRETSLAVFRIVQFDMLALKDGSAVPAVRLPERDNEGTPDDRSNQAGSSALRTFDSGSCAIEQWGDPVIVLNLIGKIFMGTFHILKSKDVYTIRYIRSRTAVRNRP
jgi:hypothetical protein